MILTEAEAKTKWCPHARVRDIAFDEVELRDCLQAMPDPEREDNVEVRIVGPFAGPAFNRQQLSGSDEDSPDTTMAPGSKCIGSACMAWRWRMYLQAEPDQHSRGYCGLSGRPA